MGRGDRKMGRFRKRKRGMPKCKIRRADLLMRVICYWIPVCVYLVYWNPVLMRVICHWIPVNKIHT